MTVTSDDGNHFVVLGGGITGLSSAFHLSRRFPKSRITLVEKEDRLGGWIKSERVSIRTQDATSSVLLEAGPRTLRPVDKSVLELIHLLDLSLQVIATHKTSPAAKSRYLYVSDLGGLLRIPSDLWSLFASESRPLSWILLPAMLGEAFCGANRPPAVQGMAEAEQDESVDAFFTRRFGEDFARVFGSALIHGIYAADSRDLSVRAAFPSMWNAETRGNGSVLLGMLRGGGAKDEEVYELGDVAERTKGMSVLSFKEGIEALPRALEKYLTAKENVVILKGVGVSGLRMIDDGQIEVTLDNSILNATHVVSALPLPVLHNILPALGQLPHLIANPSTTVTVVNLVFPVPPDKVHPPGFGYLVPRPKADSNVDIIPVIGTVFDTCSLSAQDEPPIFTKITVMIKGNHPLPATSSMAGIPDLIMNILSVLSTQLSRSLPDPVMWRVLVNQSCIPTYTIGHCNRMQVLAKQIKEEWNGQLEVVGSGLAGVSVGDCVRAGRKVFAS